MPIKNPDGSESHKTMKLRWVSHARSHVLARRLHEIVHCAGPRTMRRIFCARYTPAPPPHCTHCTHFPVSSLSTCMFDAPVCVFKRNELRHGVHQGRLAGGHQVRDDRPLDRAPRAVHREERAHGRGVPRAHGEAGAAEEPDALPADGLAGRGGEAGDQGGARLPAEPGLREPHVGLPGQAGAGGRVQPAEPAAAQVPKAGGGAPPRGPRPA